VTEVNAFVERLIEAKEERERGKNGA